MAQTCAYIKSSKKVFTHGMSPDEFVMVAEKVVNKCRSFVQVGFNHFIITSS